MLYNNAVDLVVTGHVHAYERSFPVYKGQVSVPLDSAEQAHVVACGQVTPCSDELQSA